MVDPRSGAYTRLASVAANSTQSSVAVQQLVAETSVRHPRSCRVAGIAELHGNMHHHGCAAGAVMLSRIDVEPAITMEAQTGPISYGTPQLPDRQVNLLRAQITFPIATPTYHPAAIAVHWRNPAYESVNKTAPHTVCGAVALRTCASMRYFANSVRESINGCRGLAHDICCRMLLKRHRPAPSHRFRVNRTGSLRGISDCSTPTFILPVVQHGFPVPAF